MRIAIWSSTSFDVHSAEYHIMADRIEGLSDAGHSIQLVQKNFNGGGLPEKLKNKGIQVTNITVPAVNKASFLKRYIVQLKYYIASGKHIRKDADCVFVQSNYAAWLPVLWLRLFRPKIRIIYNVQDIFPENALLSGVLPKKNGLYWLFYAFQKIAYKCSSEVITISEDMRETLIAAGSVPNKTRYIYNWAPNGAANVVSDADNDFLREHPEYRDRFCVLYAGNIGAMQNVELLVRAAEYLKDLPIEFLIVGEGIRKEQIRGYVEKRGLFHIHILPQQSEQIAWHMYCMADINIIPMVKNGIRVALPSKTASCLISGRYIVAAIGHDSQFAQKLANVCGCLAVDSEDADELAEVIRRRYGDKNNRAERYDRHEFCHAFSKEKGVVDYISIIERKGNR